MPSERDKASENPYASPQTQSPRRPIQIPARLQEWLLDRIMLLCSGCLIFAVVWGVTMLVVYVRFLVFDS